MTTKRLEIVQVMRAFACVSIFLYHLPVAWGVKSNYSGFSLVVFFIFTGYFLMEGTRKSEKFYISEKKSFALCHYIGCLRLHCF